MTNCEPDEWGGFEDEPKKPYPGKVRRLMPEEMPLHSHDPEKDGMMNSENPYEEIVAKPPIRPGEVLGVLTGQVPVRSMPIATGHTCHNATRCKVCAEDKPLDSDGD